VVVPVGAVPAVSVVDAVLADAGPVGVVPVVLVVLVVETDVAARAVGIGAMVAIASRAICSRT